MISFKFCGEKIIGFTDVQATIVLVVLPKRKHSSFKIRKVRHLTVPNFGDNPPMAFTNRVALHVAFD